MKLAALIVCVGCGVILAPISAAQAADRDLAVELIGEPIDLDTGVTTNVGGVSVAYNSTDGEYRVVWFDSRIEGQNDVYAQRVAPDGTLLGANVEIIAGPESQTDTSVAYDSLNNLYLMTWRYQAGGPGSPGFNHAYGGIVSAAGGLAMRDIDICNGGLEPTLAYNSVDNEYLLEARNFAGGGTAGIRGQRVSADGQLLGVGLTIATSGAPAPAGQVAYNANDNQYLATWRDQTAEDLKGRIINADGSFATSPFVISPMFPESGLAASVAFDPVNDHYLAVFSEFSTGGVYGQFVSDEGTLDGQPFTIAESTTRLFPFVAYDGVNGVFLVAWYDSGNGTVSVQLLLADGSVAGEPLVISGANAGNARIAANSTAGGFIVAWVDRTNWPDRADVLAQLVGVYDDSPLIGDMNCDGSVNSYDIDGFICALSPQCDYEGMYPDCDRMLADCNGDGEVNSYDIDGFIALVGGG